MTAANATVGSLRVFLGLDSAQFETGLKQAGASLGSFAKSASSVGALAATALVAAASAVGVLVKSSINAADEMSKAAQKAGVTVEELSRLSYAAELSDVSLEGLTKGLVKLSANMAEIKSGGGAKAASAFKALGVSITDANGNLRDGSAVMEDVADKFGGVRDSAEKTALAVAIFGKSGADLIPLLNSGRDGLREMNAEADALGVTISENAAKQAEAFNDNLTRLHFVVQGVGNQLAAALIPGLASVSDAMVGAAKDTRFMAATADVLNLTLKGLAAGGVVLGAVFTAVWETLSGTAKAVMQIASGDFKGAFATLNKPVLDFGNLGKRIAEVWGATGSTLRTTARDAAAVAPAMQGAGKKVADKLTEQEKAAQRAKDAADAYIDSLEKEILTFGLAAEQKADVEALAEAEKALAAGFALEAMAILRLVDARQKLRAFTADPKADKLKNVTFERTPQDLNDAARGMDSFLDRLENGVNASQALAGNLSGALDAIKSGDWGSAAANVIGALQQIKSAGMSTGNVIATLANVAGNMIGGTAGSAISGAAQGFMLGGPVGAVIGGITGLVSGIFGSKKKKKAKRAAAAEAARRAEAERAQKEADLAAARQELEIQLMEMSGDKVGALAKRRELELKALDPSLVELQKQIYAQEDLAAALQITNARRSLEADLMEATGDAAGALALRRKLELEAMDEGLRSLQAALWAVTDAQAALDKVKAESQASVDAARNDLSAAYDRESSALQGVIDTFDGFRASLSDFGRELQAQAAGLMGRGRYAYAASNFRGIAGLAGRGDQQALAAFIGAANDFLAASEDNAKTAFEAARDRALVLAATQDAEKAAAAQVDIATASLAELKNSVAGLLKLDGSVLSVRDAIAALGAALDAQAAAVAAAQARLTEATLQALAATAANSNVSVPGGPAVSAYDATKAVTTAVDIAAENVSATAQISSDLADMQAALTVIAANTAATDRTLRLWDGDGMPEARVL